MYIYKEKTGGWVIFLRVVFTLAVLYSVYFIFRNSMQAGAVSSLQSRSVAQTYNSIAAQKGLPWLSELAVRKLAHIAEYAMEGFFLMLCLRVYTSHFVRHISWPLLFGGVTALCDETIQSHIGGRASQIIDVWIDSVGLCLGIGGAFAILLLFRFLHWVVYGGKKNKFKDLAEIRKFEEEHQK